MILLDVLRYLVSKGHGEEGVSLFVGSLPSDVMPGHMLVATGGAIDPELRGLHRSVFSIVSRGPTHLDTYNQAAAIAEALRLNQQPLETSFVWCCYPRSEPLTIGRSDSGSHGFVVNYEIVWRSI